MKTVIRPGTIIDAATPDEVQAIVAGMNSGESPQVTRVRAPATIALDATGSGSVDVYKTPLGFEFAIRRIVVLLSTVTDGTTGKVSLNAGPFVQYLRSGQLIEWAVLSNPGGGAVSTVPGVQTWGDQQGAYLRNGEVFQIRAGGLTANAELSVSVEGLLRRPGALEDR